MSQNVELIRYRERSLTNSNPQSKTPLYDVNGASERSHDAQVKLHDGIDSLNQLAAQLATAMETLEEPSIPSVENGLDFYDEVRKFEISLIQRALQLTGGVQNKAAHILNLKHTTLNTKIKQYKLG